MMMTDFDNLYDRRYVWKCVDEEIKDKSSPNPNMREDMTMNERDDIDDAERQKQNKKRDNRDVTMQSTE